MFHFKWIHLGSIQFSCSVHFRSVPFDYIWLRLCQFNSNPFCQTGAQVYCSIPGRRHHTRCLKCSNINIPNTSDREEETEQILGGCCAVRRDKWITSVKEDPALGVIQFNTEHCLIPSHTYSRSILFGWGNYSIVLHNALLRCILSKCITSTIGARIPGTILWKQVRMTAKNDKTYNAAFYGLKHTVWGRAKVDTLCWM